MSTGLTETEVRLYENLYRNLGAELVSYLADDGVDEIFLNPDGSLWIDRIGEGHIKVGTLSASQGDSILRAVAGLQQATINYSHPYVEAQLPHYRELAGQRFSGQIPPIVVAPTFALRKPSRVRYYLADYVSQGRLTATQHEVLLQAVAARKNILISGGVGSGKTTLANALLATIDPMQRVILIEDTPELKCPVPDQVSYYTSAEVTINLILKIVMRMTGTRIIVGEVRGGEAYTMLKAWNTGCPGGIATIHANTAQTALQRVLDLALETGLQVPPLALLLATIDVVVSIHFKQHLKGYIDEILQLEGHDGQFQFTRLG